MDVTADASHRPWPIPRRPWVMAQRWNDLLFLHWPVDARQIRELVPEPLVIDLRDGAAWGSITPFRLSHLRPRWLPALPFVSRFEEVNVRTYATFGGKPGVFFFSLDASQALAVLGARAAYHLPYYYAEMRVRRVGDGVAYRSRRYTKAAPAQLVVDYEPTGPVRAAAPGTLDHWLSERYCLYAVHDRRLYRAEIHHRPWPLQPARADIQRNTMAAAAGITLPDIAPQTAFARRLDVVIWTPERVH